MQYRIPFDIIESIIPERNHNMKKLLSAILATIMLAGALAAALPSFAATVFSDVENGRWSAASIEYAVKNGYMQGVGGGLFDPEGSLTRAMVATVLWRREGSPVPNAPSGFDDVAAGEWYADAVAWAKETGVVKGLTETTFGPDEYITREQLATMLFRFSSGAPVSVPDRADLTPFSDDEKVSDWAGEPLGWATEAGLIKGTDGNRLAPDGFATREQFAAIIERYDGSFKLRYAEPVVRSHYTEKEYPLVTDADVYVSPDGDDGAAGDFGHPIASFGRAVEMVRSLRRTVADRSIVVAFKAGEYEPDEVILTSEDSGTKEFPVIYCAYGDGEAVLTGGASVRAEDFTPVDEDKRGLFDPSAVENIKKIGIGGILPGYTFSDVLYGDEGALWIARFPNKYPDGSDNLMKGAGATVSEEVIRISHPVMQKRIREKYHTLEGLKLYGYLTLGWFKDVLDVSGYTVDEETGGFDFRFSDLSQAYYGRLRYGEFPWEEYHASAFLNMTEDLDASGEYWVDTDALTLYVYDPHGTYVFPVRDRCITMDSCDYVTFRGLAVTGYKEKLLSAKATVGLTLDRCRFSVCPSAEGITVTGRRGPDFDTVITGCEFSVFSGNAVNVNGGYGITDVFRSCGNFLFDNNRITRTNLTGWGAAVVVGGCTGAVLSHNEFEDCSHMAIGFGEGNKNVNTVIEYNVFRNILYNNQDCGVIFGGNSQSDWGNKIRYNVFYPTNSSGGDRYAVYQDDNEPGAEIYGNLFFDTVIVIHDGRSNDVHDNVMFRSSMIISPGSVIEPLEKYYRTGDTSEITGAGRSGAFYKRWVDFFAVLDSDPEMKANWFEAFPELASLTVDLDRAGEKEFVLYPQNYDRNNLYFTQDGKPTVSSDPFHVSVGNRFFRPDENPCFVNPTLGDYRILDGADFPDIRFEDIGRY